MLKTGVIHVVVLMLAMTNVVYATQDKLQYQELSDKHRAILADLKKCTVFEDIRFIASKNAEIIYGNWTKAEGKKRRVVSMLFCQETKINTAISIPASGLTKEERKALYAVIDEEIVKVKDFIKKEDIRIIETEDYDICLAWVKEEVQDKRNVTTHFDKETGVYTSISESK